MRVVLLWIAALLLPAAAEAQRFVAPHADLPTAEQPARRTATTGYTLALSWTPEYCHGRRGDRQDVPECADRRIRSGFTLHGLWPDGDGPNRWPQYCHPVAILTEAQVRAGTVATPSPQLLQHEWAKHGSCMYDDPTRYFADEQRLYRGIVPPDMAALAARRGLTAQDVQAAFARANPGMTAAMLRLNVNKRGWLEEVWICLGVDKRPRACTADQGGAAAGAAVKVQAPTERGGVGRRSYRPYNSSYRRQDG